MKSVKIKMTMQNSKLKNLKINPEGIPKFYILMVQCSPQVI